MIHEISDCKINTWQTVMYPTHNSMRCIQAFAVKQSYRNTPVYHLVHHLQTPSTELNIVYMWGFLITLEVMTPPEPDRWTCRLLVPAPVWFSGYRPSPPTHHRQAELPSLTTTLPCQSPVYVSTHGIYLYIKKLTCIHNKWIQGVFMEHCTKTRLISMAFQGHFNLYAWKINIGEHSSKYQVSYGYYQNVSKRWFYL